MRNALVTRDLSVTFGGFKAVDGVSLNVAEGELRVLLGANGAGKTTMMDLISGRTPSTRGEVILYGEEITNWDEHRIARAGVGRKFQIPTIFRDLTVRQNLEVASCRGSGVFANLGFRFSPAQSERVEEALDLAGLRDRQDVLAAGLSHGETQWLELGLLIVQDPKVLLLDEPTAGMTQAETLKTAVERVRPYRWRIRSTVSISGAPQIVGPDATNERSSPGMSLTTSVTTRAGLQAAASLPPLIMESRDRTAFISAIVAPDDTRVR